MDNGASSYRRFLDGDKECLAEIVRDYKDGLIFFLTGFVRDIHTAEDLTEDTFVKIITKKPKYVVKSSFKTWLYTIARNVAIDYIKRNSKMDFVSIDDCKGLTGDEETLEQTYIREERKIQVHHALRKLKPEYQQILWLIYFEDLSCKEAASVMKKRVQNIETLVHRARKSLKSELEKEGFVYEELC